MTDFKKLQNGSDIRGVAIETEGGKPVNLTQNSVVRIGAAFALFAADRANKPASELRIAIGRDSRLSGEQLTVLRTALLPSGQMLMTAALQALRQCLCAA